MTAPAIVCSRSVEVSVPVRVPHHLERKRDVQEPDPAGRVERVDARLLRRALRQQRARGRVLDAAGRVIADLLDRVLERARPEGEVIGRDDVVGHDRARVRSPSRSATTCRKISSRASKSSRSRSSVAEFKKAMRNPSPR